MISLHRKHILPAAFYLFLVPLVAFSQPTNVFAPAVPVTNTFQVVTDQYTNVFAMFYGTNRVPIPLGVPKPIALTNLDYSTAIAGQSVTYNGTIPVWAYGTSSNYLTNAAFVNPIVGTLTNQFLTLSFDGTAPFNSSGASNIPITGISSTNGVAYQVIGQNSSNNTAWMFGYNQAQTISATSGSVALTSASPSVNYCNGALTANLTLNLPSAASCSGKAFTIVRNVSSGSFTVIIAANGSDKLIGSNGNLLASISLTGNAANGNQTTTFMSDGGTQWTTIRPPILPVNCGGTSMATAPTIGSVVYGANGAMAYTAAGTNGQVLTSAGAAAPVWTTPASGSSATYFYDALISGSQTTTGAWQDVTTWGAASHNDFGTFSSGVLTLPSAGGYLISASVALQGGGPAITMGTRIFQNSTVIATDAHLSDGTTIDAVSSITGFINAAANDTVKIQCFQSNGGSTSYRSNASTFTVNRIF